MVECANLDKKQKKYQILDLGLIDYSEGYSLQKECIKKAVEEGQQYLIICEHPSVITKGRLSQDKNILISSHEMRKKGVKLETIDRGGDVTLHCPGQLVAYPILNLVNFGKDLREYLRRLEQVAIDLLSEFGIVGRRGFNETGIWVGDKKIASIGVGVKKWITYHGIAINVNSDLTLFSMIRSCGLDDAITSISAIVKESQEMAFVKDKFLEKFSNKFDLKGHKV